MSAARECLLGKAMVNAKAIASGPEDEFCAELGRQETGCTCDGAPACTFELRW